MTNFIISVFAVIFVLAGVILMFSTFSIAKFKKKILNLLSSPDTDEESIKNMALAHGWKTKYFENNFLFLERKHKYGSFLGWFLCIITGILVPAGLYILLRKKSLLIDGRTLEANKA